MALFKDKYLHLISALAGLIHNFKESKPVNKILIYKLDHLGDLLISTPVIKSIRNKFPNAVIKIVAGEWSINVFKGNPYIDEIIYYNSQYFSREPYLPHNFGDLKKKIKTWNPDLIISLRDDWDTCISNLFTKASVCDIGRTQIIAKLQRKANDKFDHITLRQSKTVSRIGITNIQSDKYDFFISDDEVIESRKIIESNLIKDNFVVVHNGASNLLKEWEVERFAEIAKFIYKNYNYQIVLIGSPNEIEITNKLYDLLKDIDCINLSGRMNFRITAAFLKNARLYIGCDGGIMHLAAALGVKTIGLFGPGSIDLFKPLTKNSIGISKNYSCSPCYQQTCIRPNDSCMDAIKVIDVLLQIKNIEI